MNSSNGFSALGLAQRQADKDRFQRVHRISDLASIIATKLFGKTKDSEAKPKASNQAAAAVWETV